MTAIRSYGQTSQLTKSLIENAKRDAKKNVKENKWIFYASWALCIVPPLVFGALLLMKLW